MKGLVFGALLLMVLLFFSIDGGLGQYMQKHALLLVVGGSFALLFFTTPDSALKVLWKAFKDLVEKEEHFEDYREELAQLAKTRRLPAKSGNALVQYATELWEQGIDPNLFIVLISQRKMEMENERIDALQAMKNLSKYPPGLGITGTVMGMIALFSSLDKNKEAIGINIALAMTATFFGLLLTNVLVGPLADRIQIRYMNRKRLLGNLYKIILLINQNEPMALISGEMEDRVAG